MHYRLPNLAQTALAYLAFQLGQRDHEGELRQCYAQASEAAFAEIWDNDKDAIMTLYRG